MNKALIERFWEDLYRRDFDAVGAYFTPDGPYTDVFTPHAGVPGGPPQTAARPRLPAARGTAPTVAAPAPLTVTAAALEVVPAPSVAAAAPCPFPAPAAVVVTAPSVASAAPLIGEGVSDHSTYSCGAGSVAWSNDATRSHPLLLF